MKILKIYLTLVILYSVKFFTGVYRAGIIGGNCPPTFEIRGLGPPLIVKYIVQLQLRFIGLQAQKLFSV